MPVAVLSFFLLVLVFSPSVTAIPGPQASSPSAYAGVPSARLAPPQGSGFAGDAACRDCHRAQFDSFLKTQHHLTSHMPDSISIAGSFAPGKNVMETFNPELTFVMSQRKADFYETARVRKQGKTTDETQRIDIVVGSATKGQTYLYWKGNALFELPVSYWTRLKSWVNSPGYVDGSADFSRPVTPRCLECHATYFQPASSAGSGSEEPENHYNQSNFVLGISCERCHGPAQQHIQGEQRAGQNPSTSHLPPAGLSRERRIDICAQCHAGVGQSVVPAFSFRPGRALADFVVIPQQPGQDRVDVHGNQVALLEKSRCFQASANLTCSTCHDVHAPPKPAASYSDRCLSCHQAQQCGEVRKRGSAAAADCIDCHMPVQASSQLTVDTEESRLPARVRNHWIRVYGKN